jgi:hypothetical protein
MTLAEIAEIAEERDVNLWLFSAASAISAREFLLRTDCRAKARPTVHEPTYVARCRSGFSPTAHAMLSRSCRGVIPKVSRKA